MPEASAQSAPVVPFEEFEAWMEHDGSTAWSSIHWPTRIGFAYDLMASEDHSPESWSAVSSHYGLGQTVSVPVATIAHTGGGGGGGGAPWDVIRSAHFFLRAFDNGKTLVSWHEDGFGVSVVVDLSFQTVGDAPLYVWVEEVEEDDPLSPGSTITVLYSVSIILEQGDWSIEFGDPKFDPNGLTNEQNERLSILSGNYVVLHSELAAWASGQGEPPEHVHGPEGAGAGRAFFRVVEREVDSDGDGLPDWREFDGENPSNPFLADTDGDGVDDFQEQALNTNPNETDSDHDGVIDSQDSSPNGAFWAVLDAALTHSHDLTVGPPGWRSLWIRAEWNPIQDQYSSEDAPPLDMTTLEGMRLELPGDLSAVPSGAEIRSGHAPVSASANNSWYDQPWGVTRTTNLDDEMAYLRVAVAENFTIRKTLIRVLKDTVPPGVTTNLVVTPEEIEIPAGETISESLDASLPIPAVGANQAKYQDLTYLPMEFEIHNGQNAPRIVRQKEDIGAYTVANLNDTDGDGVIDNVDTEVKAAQGAEGVSDEVDLMKLVIRGSAIPGAGGTPTGRMKVTVVGGSVKFWEKPTKETEIPVSAGAFFVDAIELPKTVWVEATAVSASVRDIHLQLGYELESGQLVDDIDRVRATAVWVEPTANGIINSGVNAPTHMDGQAISQTFLNSHGGQFGVFFISPVQMAAHSIGFEFEIKPSDAASAVGVVFDISRQRESIVWLEDANGWDDPAPEQFPHGDMPNDDNRITDEDNFPSMNRIYSIDNPSIQYAPYQGVGVFRAVKRANFREFVRVRFDGKNFKNENDLVEGSRCSDFQPWRMRGDIENHPINGWIQTLSAPATDNVVEGGYTPLGDHP